MNERATVSIYCYVAVIVIVNAAPAPKKKKKKNFVDPFKFFFVLFLNLIRIGNTYYMLNTYVLRTSHGPMEHWTSSGD